VPTPALDARNRAIRGHQDTMRTHPAPRRANSLLKSARRRVRTPNAHGHTTGAPSAHQHTTRRSMPTGTRHTRSVPTGTRRAHTSECCSYAPSDAACRSQRRLQLRANGGRNYAPAEAAIMRQQRLQLRANCGRNYAPAETFTRQWRLLACVSEGLCASTKVCMPHEGCKMRV